MDTLSIKKSLITPDVESMEAEPINEGLLSTILRVAAAGMLTWGAYNVFMKSDDLTDAEKHKITVSVGEYGFADKNKSEKTASIDHIVRNAFSKKGFDKTGEFYSIDELCEMGVNVAKKEVACMKPYVADLEQKVETIKREARKVIDNYHVPGTPKNTCKYRGRPLQFDPEFIVLLCAYCDYDLPLLLAQLQCESIFGVTDVASTTNSLFSVGIEDSGIKAHGRYPSQDVAVMKYIKLMQNSYLVRKKGNKTVTITPTELLRSGNFVNYSGNRYASDPHYESKIKTTRNKYLSLGFGNTWEAGDPHQPLSNSRELSMNESAAGPATTTAITYIPIKDDKNNIADIIRVSDSQEGQSNIFRSMTYNEISDRFGEAYADAINNKEGIFCGNGILKLTSVMLDKHENIDELEKRLKSVFGTTSFFAAAKWLTKSGDFLNFTRPVYGEMRIMDTNYIEKGGINSEDYLKLGGISIEASPLTITICEMPTPEQNTSLTRMLNSYKIYDDFAVKCVDNKMNLAWDKVYKPGEREHILSDIKGWFNEKIKPA